MKEIKKPHVTLVYLLGAQDLEPIFNNVGRRECTVVISEVPNFDALSFQRRRVVARLTDANNSANVMLPQLLEIEYRHHIEKKSFKFGKIIKLQY